MLNVDARGDIVQLSPPSQLERGAAGFVPEVNVEYRLVWPDDLPRGYSRPEEIVVVVSTELIDLGGLETPNGAADLAGGPGLAASGELRAFGIAARSKLELLAQLRDRAIRNLEAGEAEWPFCVKRISFLLDPQGELTP
jgi:hypothetical protein